MKCLGIIAVTGFVMMVVVGCGQHPLRLDGSDYFSRKSRIVVPLAIWYVLVARRLFLKEQVELHRS
jgi:hypothetical protein